MPFFTFNVCASVIVLATSGECYTIVLIGLGFNNHFSHKIDVPLLTRYSFHYREGLCTSYNINCELEALGNRRGAYMKQKNLAQDFFLPGVFVLL